MVDYSDPPYSSYKTFNGKTIWISYGYQDEIIIQNQIQITNYAEANVKRY